MHLRDVYKWMQRRNNCNIYICATPNSHITGVHNIDFFGHPFSKQWPQLKIREVYPLTYCTHVQWQDQCTQSVFKVLQLMATEFCGWLHVSYCAKLWSRQKCMWRPHNDNVHVLWQEIIAIKHGIIIIVTQNDWCCVQHWNGIHLSDMTFVCHPITASFPYSPSPNVLNKEFFPHPPSHTANIITCFLHAANNQ